MRPLTILLFTLLQLTALPASAREVAGVSLPEQLTVANGAEQLQLNGAGVREKFFFDIYVGALYLPQKSDNTAQILAMPGAKRVVMHFLYREVDKTKLTDGWSEGFKENNTEAQLSTLAPRLEKFNQLFTTVKRGDTLWFDFIPATGTVVQLNGARVGTVAGEDFYRALLKVWLGDKPADKTLKAGMLGSN